MKPADVATLLQIAGSTVRLWASQYREFLSPQAAGGDGSHRAFSDQDIRVLHFIQQLKQDGLTGDALYQALKQMQARGFDGLPDVPDRPNVAQVPMVPAAAASGVIDAERRSLLREIATLQNLIDELRGELAKERAENTAKHDDLMNKLADARAELARQKVMVELYESGRLKPPGA